MELNILDITFDPFHLEYGSGFCAVDGCPQCVQSNEEFDKHEVKSMCYAHAKMRDGLIGRPETYEARPNNYWRYSKWDLKLRK